MISYFPNDHPSGSYVFSYQSLREDYLRFSKMADHEFVGALPEALHFACVVCFIKELSTERVLSDTGIIHELAHLICDRRQNAAGTQLREIRKLFNQECALA